MRFEVETNLYNPSALARKFSSIQTNFDVTLGKIAAIVSDSEIQEYLDGHTTMNTRLSSVIQDVDGVHTQISSMRTDYEDGFQSVDSRLTTIDETINGIHAEVSNVHREYNGLETRISSAEAKITDNAIVATVRSSESYKGDLASKNATFTGDYVPTTSNVPASSWNTTAMKESHLNDTFLTSGGELYQYISGHNGLMITFSSDSKTAATRYDYVRIYYKIGDTTYVLPDIGGTDISGASVFVPSNEFWLYWRSDTSNTYYGFRIASVDWVFSNTPTLTEATLPGIDPTPMSGTNYPETTHPYTNNEEKFWKYTHTGHSASVNPSYGWAKREDGGIRTLAERMSAAELKITDSAIVSTVRSSAAYTNDLAGKTSSSDVESIIEQKADSIRLKADKISWSSTYSSMTSDGTLTCTGANISGIVNIVNGSDSCTIGTTNTYVYRTVEGLIDVNLKCLNYIIKNENNAIAEHTWSNDSNRLNDVTATTGSYINRILALTNQSSLPIINTSSDLRKLCWLRETFTRNSSGGHYELNISHGWMYSIADSSFRFDKDGAWINGNKITTSSSKRYKHDIAMLGTRFNPHKLLQLIPKQFVYNDGKEQYQDTKGMAIPGFIAEDVAEIYPSAVIHNADGEIESWDERRIIPGMLALIQELYNRVKNLESGE